MKKENILSLNIAYRMGERPIRNKDERMWSVPVLIDLDGYRKHFRVGFYSFSARKWMLPDCEHIENRITRNSRWIYIEAYDNN